MEVSARLAHARSPRSPTQDQDFKHHLPTNRHCVALSTLAEKARGLKQIWATFQFTRFSSKTVPQKILPYSSETDGEMARLVGESEFNQVGKQTPITRKTQDLVTLVNWVKFGWTENKCSKSWKKDISWVTLTQMNRVLTTNFSTNIQTNGKNISSISNFVQIYVFFFDDPMIELIKTQSQYFCYHFFECGFLRNHTFS